VRDLTESQTKHSLRQEKAVFYPLTWFGET